MKKSDQECEEHDKVCKWDKKRVRVRIYIQRLNNIISSRRTEQGLPLSAFLNVQWSTVYEVERIVVGVYILEGRHGGKVTIHTNRSVNVVGGVLIEFVIVV